MDISVSTVNIFPSADNTALDVPIGWPLRYSHSPAEVIDLRDLRSLSRLIAALAVAPAR